MKTANDSPAATPLPTKGKPEDTINSFIKDVTNSVGLTAPNTPASP